MAYICSMNGFSTGSVSANADAPFACALLHLILDAVRASIFVILLPVVLRKDVIHIKNCITV